MRSVVAWGAPWGGVAAGRGGSERGMLHTPRASPVELQIGLQVCLRSSLAGAKRAVVPLTVCVWSLSHVVSSSSCEHG